MWVRGKKLHIQLNVLMECFGHVIESENELDFFSIYFSFCIVISNYLYMCKQHNEMLILAVF